MILKIEVNGFKTLSEFSLDLQPGLNVLVGPNGSGKTNMVSFFEFLAHLVESDSSEATSRLGGAGAIFRRINDTYQPTISAMVYGCYSLEQEHKTGLRFISPELARGRYALYQYAFTLLFSNELESVIFTSQNFRYKHLTSFVTSDLLEKVASEWDLEIEVGVDRELKPNVRVKRLSDQLVNFLPMFHLSDKKTEPVMKQTEAFLSSIITPNTSILAAINKFNPALLLLSEDITGGQTYNIIPSRVKLPEDSAKPPGIASDGSGLSATLYSLKRRNVNKEFKPWGLFIPGRQNALKTTTLATLKGYFHLANKSIADVDVLNDSFSNQLRVSFVIKNGDYTATVPLSLMSDGTLKWLTLLTAALTASSVFSIEEPENYLHPQMQGQFIKIMREILFQERRDVCTLMTTHSETVLNHCKPSELVVVTLRDGKTVAYRCQNEAELSDEIDKTGFGLGYYYISGAVQND